MIAIRFVLNSAVRRETADNGREYVVAPAVMIVEGVHHGSAGPLYYPDEMIRRMALRWEGVPVTVRHPQAGSGSAEDDGVLAAQGVGFVRSARYDPAVRGLRADIWIDVERASELMPEALDRLATGEPVEVSTGAIFPTDGVPGSWNEEGYEGTVIDCTPDHLAILPDQVGACSWEDGCGVRNRHAQNTNERSRAVSKLKEAVETLKAYFDRSDELVDNEASFEDIREVLQRTVDGYDSSEYVHFVRDVFPDTFVYVAHGRTGGAGRMWRRSYTLDEANMTAEVGDTPEAVRVQRSYVPVTSQNNEAVTLGDAEYVRIVAESGKLQCGHPGPAANHTTPGGSNEEDNEMKENLISALIANEATPWTEDDRDWLSLQDDKRLERMAPKAEEPTPKTTAPTTLSAARVPHEPAAQSVDEYIASAPEALRETLSEMSADHQSRRSELVDALDALDECEIPRTELEAMSIGHLRAIAKMANNLDHTGAVDFSGASGGFRPKLVVTENAPEPIKVFETKTI
jgi:hypothetical protein